MNKAILILITVLLCGCISRPKNFTYYYEGKSTGLDKLIDINGYYVSQRGCDSSFYTMYMFYADGLFTIATTSSILPELVDCFEKGGNAKVCKYPQWGVYTLEEDSVIRTQTIGLEGAGLAYFRDYKILPNGKIMNISDYIEPEYSNLGYMKNYPSYKENKCGKAADFFPLPTKRDSLNNPVFKLLQTQ